MVVSNFVNWYNNEYLWKRKSYIIILWMLNQATAELMLSITSLGMQTAENETKCNHDIWKKHTCTHIQIWQKSYLHIRTVNTQLDNSVRKFTDDPVLHMHQPCSNVNFVNRISGRYIKICFHNFWRRNYFFFLLHNHLFNIARSLNQDV